MTRSLADTVKHTPLLPCAHCGSTDKPKVMDWDGAGFPGFEVRCDASGWEGMEARGCGAAGGWGETPEEAAASWNRRAPDPVREKLVEALEAMLLAGVDVFEMPEYGPVLMARDALSLAKGEQP